MLRTSVSSSDLKNVGYDSTSKILEVEFHHGGVYQYRGVPQNEHRALIQATSVGSYFAAHIKNVYPYVKIG